MGTPHNPKRSYPGGYDKPRKAFKATAEQRKTVTWLSIAGITHLQIADCISVSRHTLERHFPFELKSGRDQVTGRAVGKLVGLVDDGNLQAIIFYLKTRCGWKETQVNELTGKDGKPLLDIAAVRAFMKDDNSEDE